MAAVHSYSPLDSSRNEIRLITLMPSWNFQSKITCHLFHRSLDIDTERPFDALSYTWGDTHSRRYISLNGTKFSVTASLYSALRHLRYTADPRVLWIDALCINQDDIPERNQQVTQMQKIYQRAAKVIVWLGPASINSDLAFAFLAEASLNAPHIDTWLPLNLRTKSRSKFWKAYCDIGSRDYWKRVWIIQEILFASAVIVRCGFRCMRWESFSFLFCSMVTRPATYRPWGRHIGYLGQ